jgi:DNA mismatch repair ATPase MutL
LRVSRPELTAPLSPSKNQRQCSEPKSPSKLCAAMSSKDKDKKKEKEDKKKEKEEKRKSDKKDKKDKVDKDKKDKKDKEKEKEKEDEEEQDVFSADFDKVRTIFNFTKTYLGTNLLSISRFVARLCTRSVIFFQAALSPSDDLISSICTLIYL